MGCPKCGTDNFLGLDVECSACKTSDDEAPSKYLVIRAGDFIEDAEGAFDDIADAEGQAVVCSIDDAAWCVCDADGEVLSIAYGGELYTK